MRPEAAAAPEPQRLSTVGEGKRSPLLPAPQGWTRCGNTLGVVSDPRTAPGSESWVSVERSFRSTRTQSGRRSSSAPSLFSTRQGSAPCVLPSAMPASWPQSRSPEGGRQGPGPQPIPASFPPSYPPSSSGTRGSQGLRHQRPQAWATGRMLTAAATGVLEGFAPGSRGLAGLCSSPPILEKHFRIVSPSGHFCLRRQKYPWN